MFLGRVLGFRRQKMPCDGSELSKLPSQTDVLDNQSSGGGTTHLAGAIKGWELSGTTIRRSATRLSVRSVEGWVGASYYVKVEDRKSSVDHASRVC